MKTRSFRLSKGRLAEPALHRHVSMTWKGRELLGEVIGAEYCHNRGAIELTVRHFNGEPWPLQPVLSAVKLIDGILADTFTDYQLRGGM